MKSPLKEAEVRALCELLSYWRFVLRLTGFWPEEFVRKSIFCQIKSYMTLSLYGTMAILQFVIMVTYYTDFGSAIGQVFDAATMMLVNLRLVLFLSRRRSVLELTKVAGRLLTIKKSTEESLILKDWQTHQAKIVKCLAVVYATVITVWFTGVLFTGAGLSIGTRLPSYFYEVPWFYMIFVTEFFITSIALFGLLTEDIFVTFFVCHLCSELACISINLEKLGGRDQTSSFIKNIIQNHVTTLAYGCNVRQLFSTILYVEMIPFMIGTCVSAFTANLGINSATTVSALAVAFICIFRVFIICFVGETLLQGSHEMQRAIIHSNWYLRTTENQKDVQLILKQAQKPILLRVGTIGIINLRYFGVFIFNAYSYLTVLKSAIQR